MVVSHKKQLILLGFSRTIYFIFLANCHSSTMGNQQYHSWEQQYEPVEQLSPHRLRVRRKADHSQNFELCSFIIPSEQEPVFQARIKQRQQDRNIYIQRLVHYGKVDSDGMCGQGERFNLLFREIKPTISDHCRSRRTRKQQFSAQEICYVIRSVCLGLAYLKSIGQNHGYVQMDTISTNQQVFLTDPICEQLQQQSSTFQKNSKSFPSPQQLREQYDFLVSLDEHSSDLFSLGTTALQMSHLQRKITEIYTKNASYRNTFINFDMVSKLIAGIADSRLREWVWTLMNPDERTRGRIYQMIQNYQVDVKRLRLMKENPLKFKPEQELVEPIDRYMDSQQMNKNSLVREQKIESLGKVQNVNSLASNRPSIMMPMPITNANSERFPLRSTQTNNFSSDSLIKFNHPNNNQLHFNRPTIIQGYTTDKSHFIRTGRVSNMVPFPQSNPRQFEISFKPPFTMNSQGQVYKHLQTHQRSNQDLTVNELNDSIKRLSQNLKSFIDSQSKQLSWKRQNLVVYNVDPSIRKRTSPIITQPLPQLQSSITKKLQIKKASSLYTQLVPIIPEVQEEHSNITESEYVIEQYQIGTKYEGFKRKGKRNGTGKFFYSEGSCYEGDWKDNKMHGFGVLTYPNGAYAYQGQWANDEFHGKGTLYNNDPTPIAGMLNPQDLTDVEDVWIMYQGQMANGHRSGWGKLTFINGQQFEGEFRNDEISGKGLFSSLKGTTIQGQWQGGRLVYREM